MFLFTGFGFCYQLVRCPRGHVPGGGCTLGCLGAGLDESIASISSILCDSKGRFFCKDERHSPIMRYHWSWLCWGCWCNWLLCRSFCCFFTGRFYISEMVTRTAFLTRLFSSSEIQWESERWSLKLEPELV